MSKNQIHVLLIRLRDFFKSGYCLLRYSFYTVLLKTNGWQTKNRFRLGVSLSVFDGEDIVIDSLIQLRPLVHYMNVVYQVRGNYGLCHPAYNAAEVRTFWNNLVQIGLIDEAIEYDPGKSGFAQNITEFQRSHEVDKRNIGLCAAESNGCDYFMALDNDEFYERRQFLYMCMIMKSKFRRNRVGVVKHLQYYKNNTLLKDPPEQEFVATIFRLGQGIRFEYMYPSSVPIDQSRRPNIPKITRFARYECQMHHLSYVRRRITDKLSVAVWKDTITLEQKKQFIDTYENFSFPGQAYWGPFVPVNLKKLDKPFIQIPNYERNIIEKWSIDRPFQDLNDFSIEND